ncbi:paramyosin-like [Topomyia yanbarensis]|uniref:paramyosin-like n=1 Tax=Topomyia yanbarensis TaxID=2498891 RepID=UPI00273A915E|nr:paramyosin-like [Topomyia yanbarensis]
MSESENLQAPSDCAEDEPDGSPSVGNPTWHKLLLSAGDRKLQRKEEDVEEEENAPESLLSDTTQTCVAEQSDIWNVLWNESLGNYDSGIFSFSESSKGKATLSPNGHDLHQRFVQLNTELYHTKTELLTYKYKWNEIRNEVELQWNKKLHRVVDEKISLQQEVEDLKEQLGRIGIVDDSSGYLELLKLQSDLDQLRVQLDCKDRANSILKEKITEQYCNKEKLSLELRKLEKVLLEIRNDLSSAKTSEDWFRNELHACQNANAKLKETNLLLENRVSLEKAHCQQLKLEIQQVIRNAEEIERKAYKEKDELLGKLNSIKVFDKLEQVPDLVLAEYVSKLEEASDKITSLTEINNKHVHEKEQLSISLQAMNNTLSNQDNLLRTYKTKEEESTSRIASLEEESTRLKSEKVQLQRERNELQAAIARYSFTNRELDVSLGHLRAQLKVLSINFENTRQALGVKEFALRKLEQEYRTLQDRYQLLKKCGTELEAQLRMTESLAAERYELLLDNFRKIQSKNLDLELKLGQCVEYNDKFKRSEEVVKQLREDIDELQGTIERDAVVSGRKTPKIARSRSFDKELKKSVTCVRHGDQIPSDDAKELKILLKVVESEHRHKLKRYELNNRTLLRKVKEHNQARKMAEQKFEMLQQDIAKVTSLQGEVARLRERNILLEADLESSVEESTTLKNEKSRLLATLDGNCMLRADEDIWTAFRRIFADLRDKQHVHKENGRLKEQLRICEVKIQKLEEELKGSLSSSEEKNTVIENLKLATELQRVETDEIRSELTVKTIQLEDSHRMIHDLDSERNSLQGSIGEQQLNESKRLQELDALRQQLHARDVQLEEAYDRIKLYEDSEQIITSSRQSFFDDLQFLREEIVAEKKEKQELQGVVRALKEKIMQLADRNSKICQSNSLPDSTNDSIPSLGSGNSNHLTQSDVQSKVESPTSLASCNEQALQDLIAECSRRDDQSVMPLEESIASLRTEMNQLNAVVRQYGQQRYRGVSLLDELQDATNGNYANSR